MIQPITFFSIGYERMFFKRERVRRKGSPLSLLPLEEGIVTDFFYCRFLFPFIDAQKIWMTWIWLLWFYWRFISFTGQTRGSIFCTIEGFIIHHAAMIALRIVYPVIEEVFDCFEVHHNFMMCIVERRIIISSCKRYNLNIKCLQSSKFDYRYGDS